MPRVPDASSVTAVARVRATVNTDPEKKSRTFDAPLKQGYLISTLRADETQRYARGSVLAVPSWKSLQFNGRFFLM
jgi:hypothetical protein